MMTRVPDVRARACESQHSGSEAGGLLRLPESPWATWYRIPGREGGREGREKNRGRMERRE